MLITSATRRTRTRVSLLSRRCARSVSPVAGASFAVAIDSADIVRAKIADSDSALSKLSDLTYCELIFADEATGSLPLSFFEESPEDAVRAVVIDAFRRKLAVTFCMNPRLNPDDLAQELTNDICGVSLSEHEERR